MDAAKLLEALQSAGPGAGLGLACGLLFFILGLPSHKWVMWDTYADMKAQRDEIQKRLDKADVEHKLEMVELRTELRATQVALDRTQLMVAAGVAISRKTANLASSLMGKLPTGEIHE